MPEPKTDSKKEPPSRKGIFLVLLFSLVLIVVAGLLMPQCEEPICGIRGLTWLIVVAAFLIFVIALGVQICGRPWGILINQRKLMSLSRLQIVLWTVILLSAYIAIALARIKCNVDDPLNIQLDWHLWALLGISGTSFVGSSLIQSTKQKKEPADAKPIEKAHIAFVQPTDEIEKHAEGILYGNPDVKDARFADMFEGDELNNTEFIDIAKVQMFFFTIVAALSYSVALFHALVTTAPNDLTSFPTLSDGLIAILTISHGAYLGNKTVDHTKTKTA